MWPLYRECPYVHQRWLLRGVPLYRRTSEVVVERVPLCRRTSEVVVERGSTM